MHASYSGCLRLKLTIAIIIALLILATTLCNTPDHSRNAAARVSARRA
jgi:hypothetical protein